MASPPLRSGLRFRVLNGGEFVGKLQGWGSLAAGLRQVQMQMQRATATVRSTLGIIFTWKAVAELLGEG